MLRGQVLWATRPEDLTASHQGLKPLRAWPRPYHSFVFRPLPWLQICADTFSETRTHS